MHLGTDRNAPSTIHAAVCMLILNAVVGVYCYAIGALRLKALFEDMMAKVIKDGQRAENQRHWNGISGGDGGSGVEGMEGVVSLEGVEKLTKLVLVDNSSMSKLPLHGQKPNIVGLGVTGSRKVIDAMVQMIRNDGFRRQLRLCLRL